MKYDKEGKNLHWTFFPFFMNEQLLKFKNNNNNNNKIILTFLWKAKWFNIISVLYSINNCVC